MSKLKVLVKKIHASIASQELHISNSLPNSTIVWLKKKLNLPTKRYLITTYNLLMIKMVHFVVKLYNTILQG